MNPPGWYPDPAGVPNRLRFWDGTTWVEATTYDPGTPFPAPGQSAPASGQTGAGPAGQSGPGQSGPGQSQESAKQKKLIALIAGGVAVVLLIVAGVIFVPRLLGAGGDPTDPPTPQQSQPTGPASDPQSTDGQTPGQGGGCTGGNGGTLGGGPQFTTGGATITIRDDWPWRYDKSYWSWQDDFASYGRLIGPKEEGWGAGITIGSLHQRNGFTDPQSATDAELKCISTHGPWNDPATNTWTETGSEAVEIDGMPGWKKTGTMSGTPGMFESTTITIIIVEAGQPATLASVIAFNPTGDEATAAEVDEVLASFTKA